MDRQTRDVSKLALIHQEDSQSTNAMSADAQLIYCMTQSDRKTTEVVRVGDIDVKTCKVSHEL